jgi:hypothetical protein
MPDDLATRLRLKRHQEGYSLRMLEAAWRPGG